MTHLYSYSYNNWSCVLPITGILDPVLNILGENVVKQYNLVSNYTVNFPCNNLHCGIYLNSITGSGDITITGTSIDPITNVPVISDSEILTVDNTHLSYYITNKRWIEISSINIGTGITSINYNIHILDCFNAFNHKIELINYQLQVFAQNYNSDITFRIIKFKHLGNSKFNLVDIENIGIDSDSSGNQIIDGIRTGGDDRSYNSPITYLWYNDTMFQFKQNDFSEYFTSTNEHICDGRNREGFYIRFEGSPSGGISNTDFLSLMILYRVF